MALVPQSLPFILLHPRHCWPWSWGADGVLVDHAPLPAAAGLGLSQRGGRVGSQGSKMDGAGRESPGSGSWEETRKPALSPVCSFCQVWASCLGEWSVQKGVSSEPLRPEILPASCRLPKTLERQRRLTLGGLTPGLLPGARMEFLSIQLTLTFPVSVEGQQLWVQGERKLTEGAAGPAEWPRASQRRSLPPGWH